jgi:hypothetical protein
VSLGIFETFGDLREIEWFREREDMKDNRIIVHTGNEINETGEGEDQSSSVRVEQRRGEFDGMFGRKTWPMCG